MRLPKTSIYINARALRALFLGFLIGGAGVLSALAIAGVDVRALLLPRKSFTPPAASPEVEPGAPLEASSEAESPSYPVLSPQVSLPAASSTSAAPSPVAPSPIPSPVRSAVSSPVPSPVPSSLPSPAPSPEPATVRSPVPSPTALPKAGQDQETGNEATDTARLRAAQDEYLQALVSDPSNAKALQALIAVRRKLAGDNPAVLRQQAKTYRQALAEGKQVEYYSRAALAILAQVDELAAAVIEKERRARQLAPTVTPTPTRQSALPRSPEVSRMAPRAPPPLTSSASSGPSPAGVLPSQTSAVPGASPVPRLNTDVPFYVVRLGPIADIERALEIAGALTAIGIPATVESGQEPREFRVVSEPLSEGAASRRLINLEALGFHPRLRWREDGLVQLELGPFTSIAPARAVAQQIRRKGYFAAVAAEAGAGHTIVLGPYPRVTVDAVVERIRTRYGAMVPITIGSTP